MIAKRRRWCTHKKETWLQHVSHARTRARHLKAEAVLLCLDLAPCLGIPGDTHRTYWHSCLIARSVVHSIRANTPHPHPPSLSLFMSLCWSLSPPSVEHHTSYAFYAQPRRTRRHLCQNRHKQPLRRERKWVIDQVSSFMWAVYWFVNRPVKYLLVKPKVLRVCVFAMIKQQYESSAPSEMVISARNICTVTLHSLMFFFFIILPYLFFLLSMLGCCHITTSMTACEGNLLSRQMMWAGFGISWFGWDCEPIFC